jgi:hypothetical protein
MKPRSLFKFRSFDQSSIKLLKNRELWFARPDSLNDPFEFSFKPEALYAGYDEFNRLDAETKEQVIKSDLDMFNLMGVCSFSRARKNQLMWAHYADEHKGFCIGFNEVDITSKNSSIRSIDVKYQSELPRTHAAASFHMPDENSIKSTINSDTLNSIIGTKYTSWKHERERRLVLPLSQALVFTPKSVKSIAFGLRMPLGHQAELRELLSGTEWSHVKWYQCVKSDTKFSLEFVEI